ncbi:outer membrane beta-barrel family protein [Flavobacterium johnsoniae]|uniref:TonB-dependent receptor n=1 Tax=Flavobacterium johnsoniae (strain ATCC 17061 / DSM 2064 / JCM 8514 / BCRC 14874 / CCUG 350202 / NBRC 14942 / NCIMB 11054 / UW101) TaxID=376686 RepID=A5FAJ0_FLAJ1|nr:outer membrane beta-barrel family protein [Flavobacterium johnsoniae]ABQ07784.1 TonB-dependent receptor [Flavobacterium johnsoniae UW101]OXG01867.1 TonB-dependent receptor [Flavobacterium johnsoniae UW101]WQG80374.1 outer membrane beta-barrel family protein [Flavobacterium johnsoniae UW101]SHL02102.1 Outer membrane receptor for ferrienterochelin and colicins [Flavobacterium johnsoniae]
MKQINFAVMLVLFLTGFYNYAQQGPPAKNKVKVTGKVFEKVTKQPLEYATISIMAPNDTKVIAGGITNPKGEFEVAVAPGTYDIKVEFISFKSTEIKQKSIQDDTNLGVVNLSEDAAQLNEVVVRAEKSTVEIKLDKKVYNVGQDMMVKGGTVSDVLDNVPSVSVDSEGNVSLRGSDNIRILIDGRPSQAINVAEALRQLPADAIEKVEVITNPSARYDAEGGSGIINIILKKGKNQGFNGTFIASTGLPETYGLSANVNYKTEKLNYFTTAGYNYRTNEGGGLTNTSYYNADGSPKGYLDEDRDTKRIRNGFNARGGVEWTITPTTFWTNAINYQKNTGEDKDLINYNNFDAARAFTGSTYRLNNTDTGSENVEFTSNLIKNFNDKGHKLTADLSVSRNTDNSDGIITASPSFNTTLNDQVQKQVLLQADYVLPLGKGSQFEAGYKGSFGDLNNEYYVTDENYVKDPNKSNTLEYKENINALYAQYGLKVNKFSYLFGLRWEDTNIQVNLLDNSQFNTKKYNNLFPSAFISYEISDQSNLTASYSKRLTRPRGRFMNPALNYSSNINIFQGNPDLDPSLTDKYDVGYIKRWEKVTFSTSAYFENTKDVFSFVRTPNGDNVDGIPVILSRPINLGREQKYGFEFTFNYTPFKWWRLNSNFNLYNVKTTGENTYTDTQNNLVVQNLDNQANTWFARINSKVTLPYKIDWQLNGTYNGEQKTAQGKNLDQFSMNTALSKDILKDKATIAFNISDIFNSRIMRSYTYLQNDTTLESQKSYSEMQFRKRQFNLSFTYRFNKPKSERDKNAQPKNDGGGEGSGDFPG